MTMLTNIFIIEEEHLRAITSRRIPEVGEMKVSDMLFYGMSASPKFIYYMNLVVVTNRHEGTMRVVKNRWIDFDKEWTNTGVHSLDHLPDLIDWVKSLEAYAGLPEDVRSDDN